MKKNILQTIFFDKHQNWAKFLKNHGRRIRPVVKKEVAKFESCGDIRKGYRLFVCEGCHSTKLIALKCKGKFCLTCAVAKNGRLKVQYAKDRQARHYMLEVNQNIAKEAYQTKYKQAEAAAYDRCRFSWKRQRRIYLSEMPQA